MAPLLSRSSPLPYLGYGSAGISLLPTPIIIIAFLKTLREVARNRITCGQLSKRAKEPKTATCTSFDCIGTVRVSGELYRRCDYAYLPTL